MPRAMPVFAGPVLMIAALLASTPVAAARCEEDGRREKPAWIEKAEPIEGFYAGIGVSERGELSLSQQRDLARQSALRDLVSGIEVFVRSELRMEETTGGGADGLASKVDYRAVTEAAATALLSDAKVRDTWTDPDSCALWLRIVAPQAAVREQQRKQAAQSAYKLLRDNLDLARRADENLVARERASAQAQTLLGRIDFTLLPDGATQSQWRRELEEVQGLLAKARSAGQDAGAGFAAGEAALKTARTTGDKAARVRALLEARAELTRAASAGQFGVGPDFWAEKSLWELALYEQEIGYVCEAAEGFQQVLAKSPSAEWRERAQARSREAKCTGGEKTAAAWRRLVLGKPARAVCVNRLSQRNVPWDRACRELETLLRHHGALEILDGGKDGAQTMLAEIERCLADSCASTPGVSVMVKADGTMASRDSPQNPLGQEHQFRGTLAVVIAEGGKARYTDQYSGLGGWNPVSAELAMEVVALQLTRRLNERLAENYGQAP